MRAKSGKPEDRIQEKPVPLVQESRELVRIEQVGFDQLELIRKLNLSIFKEQRIINSFERADVLMLVAYLNDQPVGFKVGYRYDIRTFYSAKGGVLSDYRRRGLARRMLYGMMDMVREKGYRRFLYDTFPNKNPGMAILGFKEGFTIIKADYNTMYKDYRIQLMIDL